jgi:hypothetical protein
MESWKVFVNFIEKENERLKTHIYTAVLAPRDIERE